MILIQGTCESCGKVFNVKLREKNHPGKIIETYFRCTHCKYHYTSFVKDAEVRQLQVDIKSEVSPFKRFGMQQQINMKMKSLKESIL